MSTNVLPLTQAGNNTNSAISLTEIFDRVFSDVCNSLGFEVQKQKNGDRGTIVFTATLIAGALDEEQWEITQGSKMQAERTGFLAQYLSGLRHTDAPHTT